jgi:hypothetical protein
MTTISLAGFVVRETEAAIAFVRAADAAIEGIKPLWLPRKKVASLIEADAVSRKIQTAQDGTRQGVPVSVEIDAAFAAKVGVA